MNKTVIFDLVRSSFVDGPGIRTTVFLKGCNLRCAWCHNPESQPFAPQLMFYRDKCKGCGKCAAVCPHHLESCDVCGKCAAICPHDARKLCGKEQSAQEIAALVAKDAPFYELSGGGVTFSGGECMLHIDWLTEALRLCKEKGIHTAVDTAGCVPWESFEKVLPHTDLFLYDIKMMDAAKHKQYVGADNALLLDNLTKLLQRGAKVWIRIPVIAGINDSAAEMTAIRDFLAPYAIDKIELLPYHAMGENKYRALGGEPEKFTPPSAEKMAELKAIFGITE